MSETRILCEGFHDRAFWDGWLTYLGCSNEGFRPGTTGYPAPDPWGGTVRGGQFAYHSRTGRFLRVVPCQGKDKILLEARIRLQQRTSKALLRLVINVDSDVNVTTISPGTTGLKLQHVEQLVQQIDPAGAANPEGDIEIDGGATKVSLIRWEAGDPAGPGLPNQQTLERLVTSALVAAYPSRAKLVQDWLDSHPEPPPAGPKEYAWSYMAGWYADFGCDAFYANLWKDGPVAQELQNRLRASGAWAVAERIVQ